MPVLSFNPMEEEKTSEQKVDEAFTGYRDGSRKRMNEAELAARAADNARLTQEAEDKAKARAEEDYLYNKPSQREILEDTAKDSIAQKFQQTVFGEEAPQDKGSYE